LRIPSTWPQNLDDVAGHFASVIDQGRAIHILSLFDFVLVNTSHGYKPAADVDNPAERVGVRNLTPIIVQQPNRAEQFILYRDGTFRVRTLRQPTVSSRPSPLPFSFHRLGENR
jgi:hypothetical protein